MMLVCSRFAYITLRSSRVCDESPANKNETTKSSWIVDWERGESIPKSIIYRKIKMNTFAIAATKWKNLFFSVADDERPDAIAALRFCCASYTKDVSSLQLKQKTG